MKFLILIRTKNILKKFMQNVKSLTSNMATGKWYITKYCNTSTKNLQKLKV